MNANRIIVKWAFLLCLTCGLSPVMFGEQPSTQEDPSSIYEFAVQSYKSGDYAGAISTLEVLLKKGFSPSQTKDSLIEVLLAASEKAYRAGHFEESYQYLSRGLELSPDIHAVNQIYGKIQKSKTRSSAVSPAQKNTGRAEPLPSDVQSFARLVEKMVQGQKEILDQNQKSFDKIIQDSAEEKKEILESLHKRENILMEEVRFGRKYSIGMVIGSAAVVFFLVFLTLGVIHRIAARREKILIEQGEKFAQLAQEQSVKTLGHFRDALGALPQLLPGASPKVYSQETLAKLKQIDVIDAEIVQDIGSARIDPEMLRSLLGDPNPEVKSRTIQILLKYDPAEAYRQLHLLCASHDPATRVLAAKLMSGIATPESVQMLTPMMHDTEAAVKRQSYISLKGFLNENIASQLKEEIETVLAVISEKGEWVV